MSETSPLFRHVPGLQRRLGWARLGAWPTALKASELGGGRVWIKREDASSRLYGGNKIRPIEMVFGAALRAGERRVWATGAYGSNHALATVLHADRVGLEAGAILWPQPWSATAAANLSATVSSGASLRLVPTIAAFPPLAWASGWPRGERVMVPGAAGWLGALGHAGAALELAEQWPETGEVAPRTIVLPVGSTCTTAGLLVGTELVASLGVAWRDRAPVIHAVRVTPWPVTAAWRIARLAASTARALAELGGPRLSTRARDYRARLRVTGDYLGRGYGEPTLEGIAALVAFERQGAPRLDTTYSAKAAAYLLAARSQLEAPIVFWATKSSAPLPSTDHAAIARLPVRVRRWLEAG